MTRLSLFNAIVVIGLAAISKLDAAESEPSPLVYRFTGHSNLVFKVQIESQGESGRERVAGHFVVRSTNMPGGLCELSFQGQLRPVSTPGQPGMMPYYRPGNRTSLAQLFSGPGMRPGTVIIDDRGRVHGQSFDVSLPVPLGELMTSLITELVPASVTEWEDNRLVNILDEPLLLGPVSTVAGIHPGYGPPMGQSGQRILRANLMNDWQVASTDADADTVTLKRETTLESLLTHEGEPCVNSSGKGEFVLDQKLGVPRRVQLECTTLVVTENVSRRTVVNLLWELLEGEEREKVLNPPEQKRVDESKPLDEEELDSLVAKLQSTNEMSRAEAARDLVNRRNRIQSPTEEFLKLVASLVEDRNETVRNAAVSMLAEHGTKDHVPLLIRFLPTADQSLRPRIVQGLGRIGDLRAAEPLANLIAVGPVHQLQFNSMREDEAGKSLVALGESAEPTVLPLLNERNAQTRVVACGVLKEIGTHRSIRPLQDLTLSPVKEVSEAAAEALRKIHARESR